MLVLLRPAKRFGIAEGLVAFGVDGFQADALAGQGSDAAAREYVHREIHGDRARMEQVERPDVHGSASQVHAAGAVRDDGSPLLHHASFATANTSSTMASRSRSVERWFTIQARRAKRPWMEAFEM